MQNLKILSYNIHKGFNSTNLNFILQNIKESIEIVHADIVFLQEVVGHHEKHGQRISNWPKVSQFEYLADKVWSHYVYGKNAVYTQGHHGNAILSKFPILFNENINVSNNTLEQRGILHAVIELHKKKVHLICLHFDLFEGGRRAQLHKLCDRVKQHIPDNEAVLIAGDFNDWRESATGIIRDELKMGEVFLDYRGSHAKTFPSRFPLFKLDRIYYRGFKIQEARTFCNGVWGDLSDHAALYAEMKLTDKFQG